jgi:NADH dehydrogenase [ubiquinone] 1 alpha subcomplex assembly factor 1
MIGTGLRSLFGLLLMFSTSSSPSVSSHSVMDFGKAELSSWRALNDGVMGGRSVGNVSYSRSTLKWEGRVSLENNGGFSSVRSPWSERDLSGFDAVTIRCRTTAGSADTFTLTMEVSEQWWMPYWKTDFKADTEWKEIVVPFSALKKSSAMTGELPKIWSWGNLSKVLRLGMMKYDGLAGEFGLEVDWMRFSASPENQP